MLRGSRQQVNDVRGSYARKLVSWNLAATKPSAFFAVRRGSVRLTRTNVWCVSVGRRKTIALISLGDKFPTPSGRPAGFPVGFVAASRPAVDDVYWRFYGI